MEVTTAQTAAASGLWHNNSVLVQITGLSPLLALTTTATTALGLGLATALVTVSACITCSLLRAWLPEQWRLVYYLAIVAFFTTVIGLILEMSFYPLHRQLGIYLPLICANGAILLRMETFSRHHRLLPSLQDALATALGFLWLIVLLGALRELTAYGTVFAHLDLLKPGRVDQYAEPGSASFRFSVLQPGALIILGLLVAGLNLLNRRRSATKTVAAANLVRIKRVRVTGRP
ncbi:MAG: Rnf-Nqr domain containing protein [Pseudohongiellaceae bacterium]